MADRGTGFFTILWLPPDSIRPASSDASFRRYFRIDTDPSGPGTVIAMDAPPDKEDCQPFIHAAQVLGQAGVNTPTIHLADPGQGFLLLADFGNQTLLDELQNNPGVANDRYLQAGRELVTLQKGSRPDVFANYDHPTLLRELRLFDQWYLSRHIGMQLPDAQMQKLADIYELIIASNLSQPSVFVHRDYHSRNLMVTSEQSALGVIDFQDALYGPITYDLVSLLRDAYIQWPEEQVLDWSIRYWERAREASLPVDADFGQFYRDFEWMGLQRHLKVLGIFARLNYRDGKSNYLKDLPLVLDYVTKVAARFTQLTPLVRILERAATQ